MTRALEQVRRWQFLVAAILTALAAPPAMAQTAQKVHRLAILQLGTASSVRELELEFEKGMKDLGYVEGRNIVIERRYANGRADRLHELAAELARSESDVIFAPTTPAALAAKDAGGSTPIVIGLRSGGLRFCGQPGEARRTSDRDIQHPD